MALTNPPYRQEKEIILLLVLQATWGTLTKDIFGLSGSFIFYLLMHMLISLFILAPK